MALRGIVTNAASAHVTSLSVDVSTIGVQAGDLILLHMQGGGGTGLTFTWPTGFAAPSDGTTTLGNQNEASSGTEGIMYKFADGTETSLSVGSSANNFATLTARVYSGRNSLAPFTKVAATTTQFNQNSPFSYALAGVTAAAGDDVVCFAANRYADGSGTASFTPASGYTNGNVAYSQPTQFSPITVSFDALNVSAGATGTIGGTFTRGVLTGLDYCGYTLALSQGTAGAALAANFYAEATLTASLPAPWGANFYAEATFTGGSALSTNLYAEAVLQAALTNWAAVLLTAPLYTGIGSALDPYLWTTPLPGDGTTLYYDPTFITILPDGEISSTSNNCTAVLQFNDPTAGWIIGVLRIAPTGVAVATGEASFTATLSGAATQFRSSFGAIASVIEAISTSISMTAEGDALASMQANLTLAANLATQAGALASLGASMTNAPRLATAAAALASLVDQLSTTIRLASQALAEATMTAQMTNGILLAATPSAKASLTSNLRIGAILRTSAGAIASLQDSLTTVIRLAAAGYARASFAGSLKTGQFFQTSAAAKASFRGSLSTGVGFATQFGAESTFTPTLFYGIKLATLFSAVADLDPELLTLQLLTTPVPVQNQIPGVYQPSGEPWGQFPIGAGGRDYYGIDWTYWLAARWLPGANVALAAVVRPFPWTGLEYICTNAGTSGNYPPVWPEEVGLFVVDGSAIWQAQDVSGASLTDTVVSATYAPPAGILATPYLPQGQLTPVLIDAAGATPGTTYDVVCTVVLASGRFLIGHLVFDVN